MSALNIATVITGSAGLILMLISLTGIIRLPDFYTRLHAAGVGDTLGALLIIISMMLATGSGLMSAKLFLVIVIILLTNPVGTNLMMIAGMNNKEFREYKKYSKVSKEKAKESGKEKEKNAADN